MKKFHKAFSIIMLFILFLPIVMTFIYSIATEWHSTILPEGITFKWYIQLFSDINFIEALGRTLLISLVTVLISITIMVPTVYIIVLFFPKWEKIMQSVVLLPYAIPGVICSVGLIQVYSNSPVVLTGTVYLLIGAYFVLILPFMYQGVRNSLRNINVVELVQAAEILGANKIEAFLKVVLPNILSGVIVSSLLSFSMLFGEFVITNFIVGSRFETVQVYLKKLMDTSGHLSSAIVIAYFIFILITTTAVIKLSKKSSTKKAVEDYAVKSINQEIVSKVKEAL